MKTRMLKTGLQVPELDEPKILTVKTRCPEKWQLTDLETGEVYIGYSTEGNLSWRKVDNPSK